MLPKSPVKGRPCGLALGSNIGDRAAWIAKTVARIGEQFGPVAQSRLYETAPVGCPENSGAYINAVVEIVTDWEPLALLEWCNALEAEFGRVRTGRYGDARTIDIDLLYMGSLQCETTRLTLPHPRAHERRFVLRPLADIRPGLVLPGQKDDVATLLRHFSGDEPEPVPLSTCFEL